MEAILINNSGFLFFSIQEYIG